MKPRATRRLLIVTTIPATFAAFLAPYARHFRERGWTVELATGSGPVPDEAAGVVDRVIEIPWSRSFSDRRNFTDAIRVFRGAVHRGGYHVVHVHTPIAAGVARASIATLRRTDRPLVLYTAHGFHFGTRRGWHRELPFQVAEWVAGRYTDRLIVINETDRRNAERLRIVRRDRIVHLPGIGIDLAWYDRTDALLSEASRLRAELGLTANRPLFSMVAALHPGKGHIEALRALAVMRHTDAHLALAGSGILRPRIEAEIARLELSERVHVLGDLADIRPLVLASDATVLPSVREGLSRAVLESLALGVPVVGTDIRGIADSVGPDGGILVPPGDVVRLAGALDAAADRPLLDEQARAELRKRLAAYSIEALLAAHDDVYGDLLDRAGS